MALPDGTAGGAGEDIHSAAGFHPREEILVPGAQKDFTGHRGAPCMSLDPPDVLVCPIICVRDDWMSDRILDCLSSAESLCMQLQKRPVLSPLWNFETPKHEGLNSRALFPSQVMVHLHLWKNSVADASVAQAVWYPHSKADCWT